MRAERDGTGLAPHGEKTSISLGMAAHTAIVFARTSEDGARGISAFYVDLDERHVQRSAFKDLGSKSIGRAALHFDGLPVAGERLIGGEGEGFIRCMQGFEFSRALIGLMCIACASAGIEEALAYARDREAFGKPIGANQGVGVPLAEAAKLLRAKALPRSLRGVCERRDAGLLAPRGGEHGGGGAEVAVEAAHQALLTPGTRVSEELPAGQRSAISSARDRRQHRTGTADAHAASPRLLGRSRSAWLRISVPSSKPARELVAL